MQMQITNKGGQYLSTRGGFNDLNHRLQPTPFTTLPFPQHQSHPTRRPKATLKVSAAAVTAKPSLALTIGGGNNRLAKAQQAVLDAIKDVKGRGKSGLDANQQAAFDSAVAQLEASGGGIQNPTTSPLLEGRWKLVFTTRPGTASPIQRSFTAVEQFSVYQEIDFTSPKSRVNNIVDFGPKLGLLKVEAEGSTDKKPIPGFTPRRGSGLPFGILGVSTTDPPAKPNLRVDFQFDQAAFYFKALPFSIPYPVPFRLLGDERKGWIDVTYLSPDGKFRLSRGNKGTLFVLVKDESPKEVLLNAIASSKASDAVIEELVLAAANNKNNPGVSAPAKSKLALGKWRLRWTKQGGTANPLQKALAGRVLNWQIIRADGSLENRVALIPGLATVRAIAECEADKADRTGVDISQVLLELGPLKFKIPVKQDARGFVDWLYLDDDMRITRGSKGSLFVHTRDIDDEW